MLLDTPPKRLGFVAALFVLLAGALILFVSVFLRHVPYSIPAELRAPRTAGGRGLSLRYLGIAGYELTDGETTVLIDPTVTRPTFLSLLFRKIDPWDGLSRKMCPRADYILVKHAHYDHLADVPSIALRTGAKVIGTRSALNLCLSRGVPADRLIEAAPGGSFRAGSFEVRVASFRHVRLLGLDFMTGTISPGAGRMKYWEYVQDGCLSFHLASPKGTVWFAGPGTFDHGADLRAETVIFGVGGREYEPDQIRGMVRKTGAKRLLAAHYDNFFQPLSKGMALLPVLDLDALRRTAAAGAPDVPLYLLDHDETIRLR